MSVGVRTHALHYGTEVFEGIRAYWNADQDRLHLFRPLDHYERLARSASMLGMHMDETAEDLCDITTELLARNGAREDTYIRPLLFKSTEALGLWQDGMPERLVIFASPFRIHTSSEGAHCCVSTWRRPDGNVSDHGPGFDIDRFDPEATPDPWKPGGRGLWLIARLMDDVEPVLDDGLTVRMTKLC